MDCYIGIQCSTEVYFDLIVKVSGDVDKKEANRIAYETARKRLPELNINIMDVDLSEARYGRNWDVQGHSEYDFDSGYTPDLEVDLTQPAASD